jgi:hypothetical protein
MIAAGRLCCALVVVTACAPLAAPGPGGPAAPPAADDSDPRTMVPGPIEALLWIDLALVRGSRWARPLLAASSPEERAARVTERGFDDIADVDLWVLAKGPAAAGGATETVEILQGRFDRARARQAFVTRRPGAKPVSYRGTPALADAEAALAFVTDRTLVLGAPSRVEAAVAAAWGRGRSGREQPWLAAVVAALEDEVGRRGKSTAVELAVEGIDEVRGQLRDVLGPEGESIARLGARVSLAGEARATVVGVASDRAAAAAAARALDLQAAALRRRRSIAALGLRPVLDGLRVSARGGRVVAELTVSEGDREQVAERLAALAELLGKGP